MEDVLDRKERGTSIVQLRRDILDSEKLRRMGHMDE